jgi:hypothetical protein
MEQNFGWLDDFHSTLKGNEDHEFAPFAHDLTEISNSLLTLKAYTGKIFESVGLLDNNSEQLNADLQEYFEDGKLWEYYLDPKIDFLNKAKKDEFLAFHLENPHDNKGIVKCSYLF